MLRGSARSRPCRFALWSAILVLVLVSPTACEPTTGPRAENLDFEDGRQGELPPGWSAAGAVLGGFRAGLSLERPHGGKGCLEIRRDAGGRYPNCFARQTLDAAPYRGHRIRLSGWLRFEPSDSAETIGSARLWIRAEGTPSAYPDFETHPVRSPHWTFAHVTCEVAADADSFSFGGYLNLHGRAWFDDLSLSVVGRNGEGNQGPHRLDDLAVENLVAFARLLGYVRHFHPSDEAANTDWDAFAIAGVIQVESARSPSDLKARLERLFRAVAPTVRLSTKPLPPLEIGVLRDGSDVAGIIGWHHRGWAGRFPEFFVQRRIMARENAPGDSVLPIGSEMNTRLGGGVWCSVPLTLYTGHRGTVPRGSGAVRLPERPEGWIPTGNDRATRLAGVILSWNVIQHFHPYLGVIDADWPAQLPVALREAAVDTDGAAYEKTLRRLAATAQDGHVYVTSPYAVRTPRRWPFAWSFVEDRLVLTQVDTTLLKDAQVGDQVITIQGRPVEEWISGATPLEGGATPEHVRVRVARDLPSLVGTDTLTLDLRSPTGQARRSVVREHDNPSLRPSLPDSVEEVRPGVWYLDLNRITDADLESTLPRINTGKGVIFDLRGYPRHAFRSVIAHLSETAVQYPRQGFPVILRPDHSDTTFAWGTWSIGPAQPRIQTRAAFLIDANAISAAETLLSIVEHYRLAELVGERTAGTNGVITEVRLPGRYSVSFTGMRVLKHNGNRHHGVGILPTVPVSRTIVGVAAGRDEQLERAIEVVSH